MFVCDYLLSSPVNNFSDACHYNEQVEDGAPCPRVPAVDIGVRTLNL